MPISSGSIAPGRLSARRDETSLQVVFAGMYGIDRNRFLHVFHLVLAQLP
jgi:hypothetical protein